METEEHHRKKLMFRGKTLEELKEMSVREFANFTKSKLKRHLLRNFQETEKFIQRSKIKISKGKPIKTHQRDIVITPGLVGMKIFVHNGRQFLPVEISFEMLCHKLGEFSLTRTKVKHSKTGVGATKGTKHKSKK